MLDILLKQIVENLPFLVFMIVFVGVIAFYFGRKLSSFTITIETLQQTTSKLLQFKEAVTEEFTQHKKEIGAMLDSQLKDTEAKIDCLKNDDKKRDDEERKFALTIEKRLTALEVLDKAQDEKLDYIVRILTDELKNKRR